MRPNSYFASIADFSLALARARTSLTARAAREVRALPEICRPEFCRPVIFRPELLRAFMHEAPSEHAPSDRDQPRSKHASIDSTSLASMLRPALEAAIEAATGERVEELFFFRTEWQRGGAATGRARTATRELVVKLPVNDAEIRWFRRLNQAGHDPLQPNLPEHMRHRSLPVVAQLIASGETLGGFDLAWIALERLPHGPLVRTLGANDIARLAQAHARFALATTGFAIDRDAVTENWNALLDTAVNAVRAHDLHPSLHHHQVWAQLLKQVTRDLGALVALWDARPTREWIHGDLHPGNALSRSAEPDAPIVLIDLANVRPGHWLEDAVALERLMWTRADLLATGRPVPAIASARRAHGLELGPEWDRLARVRRVLLAATAPAFLRSEGSPAFLGACIGQLERNLRELGSLRALRPSAPSSNRASNSGTNSGSTPTPPPPTRDSPTVA